MGKQDGPEQAWSGTVGAAGLEAREVKTIFFSQVFVGVRADLLGEVGEADRRQYV